MRHEFLIQPPMAELAVVADSFHTKPLRQFLELVGYMPCRTGGAASFRH